MIYRIFNLDNERQYFQNFSGARDEYLMWWVEQLLNEGEILRRKKKTKDIFQEKL